MDMQPPPGLRPEDGPPPDAPRVTPARLLEYRRGRLAALPVHAALELLPTPPVVPVPGAPYYSPGLVEWQGRHLPLIDLGTLLRAYPEEQTRLPGHVLVVAWQAAPRQPLAHGALCAPWLVQQCLVDDAAQCPLPEDSDLWPYIAASCFLHEGRAVPVLDTARVFGQVHG